MVLEIMVMKQSQKNIKSDRKFLDVVGLGVPKDWQPQGVMWALLFLHAFQEPHLSRGVCPCSSPTEWQSKWKAFFISSPRTNIQRCPPWWTLCVPLSSDHVPVHSIISIHPAMEVECTVLCLTGEERWLSRSCECDPVTLRKWQDSA